MDVAQALANENLENNFLGGQNPFTPYQESAATINLERTTVYDSDFYFKILQNMTGYFNGTISLQQAWNNFYKEMERNYPQLDFGEDR